MSVELVLVPLAIAAVAAARSRQEYPTENSPDNEIHVQSRMRDQGLLIISLRELGATVRPVDQNTLLAETLDGDITMRRDSAGLWAAHFPQTWTLEKARTFIEDLDRAYGLQVQQAVIQRLQQRAPEAGMRITSQSIDDDRVVTLMMEVEHA